MHQQRKAQHRSAHAFTLLELLLAVTVLASMSVLIGSLWSQMRDWTSDEVEEHARLRLPRVIELLRSQWAERRTIVPVSESGGSFNVGPEQIEFVTAMPILFPDWPLVVARYRIERAYDRPHLGQVAWHLVYEETKVGRLVTREEDESGEPGSARFSVARSESSRIVLLEGCTELRLERYGAPFVQVPDDDAPDEGRPMGAPEREPDAWRVIEPDFGGPLPAVRLSGAYLEEPFAWVLAGEDSR